MDDAIFKLPTPLMLSKVVDAMDDLYTQMAKLNDSDARGDVYEYLLSKLATAGVNGQFRTPRHIIKMMVELMDPKADDVICDPSCVQLDSICGIRRVICGLIRKMKFSTTSIRKTIL